MASKKPEFKTHGEPSAPEVKPGKKWKEFTRGKGAVDEGRRGFLRSVSGRHGAEGSAVESAGPSSGRASMGRRAFTKAVGLGVLAAALGIRGKDVRADETERAASAETARPAQTHSSVQPVVPTLEPVTQGEVMRELVPAIESSRQYLRDMEGNKPWNWEVELHPGSFPEIQEIIVLDVYAKTPNGRVKAGEVMVSPGKFIILEIPTEETAYAGSGVLAIVSSPGTVDYSYYDKQNGQYKTVGRGASGVLMDSKPTAAVIPLSDQSGINIVFLPESALQRNSDGKVISVSIGTNIVVGSLVLGDSSMGSVRAFADGLVVISG